MHSPPRPIDEEARLAAVREFDLNGPAQEWGLDRIVELAARMFDVPIAIVSLVDEVRVVFPAQVGLDAAEADRELSFCSHAVADADLLIVPDATNDPRFHDNPLVTGDPHVRFYAGAPLKASSGHSVGALCLIDHKPRCALSEGERRNLRDLADLVTDRLELRRLDVAQRLGQHRFQQAAETSPDAIICVDSQRRITFWNPSAARLLGHTAEEAIAADIGLIVPERLRAGHDAFLTRVAAGEPGHLAHSSVERDARRKDGSEIPVEVSLSMWREGGEASFAYLFRDTAERRPNEERLYRLAQLDPLTRLPTRLGLRSGIESAMRKAQAVTLLIVDLDGFKDVNDTLGASTGDAVLRRAAARISACLRPADVVARLGGDEFGVLICDKGDPREATETADAIIQAIAEPFSVNDEPVHIGCSIGIALGPAHGEHAEDLLSSASLALYQAKGDGRHCRRLFAPDLRHAAAQKRAHEVDLRRAVEQGEFELFYQPQVRLEDDALVGAEALIRWRHPDHGLLSPATFLPALETGLFAAVVGDWVVETACRQAAVWRQEGAPEFRIGVNLFSAQFRAGDLSAKLKSVLARTGLPPQALEVEITENIILRHDEAIMAPLRDLRESGVAIAFDDYGTGYASLSLLKRFPLTRLKVDQSFVRSMCASPSDAAIVRAVLYLGRSFGLDVIAEGVETSEQRLFLYEEGCVEAQGYLFGRPVPAAEFAQSFKLGPQEPKASCEKLVA